MSKLAKTLVAVGAVALVDGCYWKDFDDLQDATWVASVAKPSAVGSDDWGYGLVSGRSAAGTELPFVAIGRSDASIVAITFDASGSVGSSIADESPGTIVGPPSDQGGHAPVGVSPDGKRIVVAATAVVNSWNGTAFDADLITSAPIRALTVDDAGTLYLASKDGFAIPGAGGATECASASPTSETIALAAVPGAAGTTDIWAWRANGEVAVYLAGLCVAPPRIIAGVGEAPAVGAIATTATHAYFGKYGDMGSVTTVELATGTVLSTTAAPKLAAIAAANLQTIAGAQDTILLGFPTEVADGVEAAGKVRVYTRNGATLTQAFELYDAKADNSQFFGRAVATTEIDGKPVLLVGANNELFAYFRTALFDETRAR